MLTVGSLFSGIGGIDLGLERAGMRVIWQAEIDPYASKVLAKHWPTVPNLGDVTEIDWSSVERTDLVCGGYPCQPFSYAGRRGGTDDRRHLWPLFADALRLLRPRWALLENVPGHLTLGFAAVLADLASLGFDAEWTLLPAAAVGAPHLRYRLFVVAHAQCQSGDVRRTELLRRWAEEAEQAGLGGSDVAHANGKGPQGHGRSVGRRPVDVDDAMRGRHGPSSRAVFAGGDRPQHASWWAVEPDVGRVAHGIPHRVDRLRCLGNAVVPQVAEWIGRRIMTAHFDGSNDA